MPKSSNKLMQVSEKIEKLGQIVRDILKQEETGTP